jgi:hypothetical protein
MTDKEIEAIEQVIDWKISGYRGPKFPLRFGRKKIVRTLRPTSIADPGPRLAQ